MFSNEALNVCHHISQLSASKRKIGGLNALALFSIQSAFFDEYKPSVSLTLTHVGVQYILTCVTGNSPAQ